MLTQTIIENLLIISAEAFWLLSNYSQLAKLVHTRNPKGLYAPTLTLYAAGNIGWMVYFASENLWVPFVTNFAMFIITGLTISYLVTNKSKRQKAILSVALVAPLAAWLIVAYPASAGWFAVIFNTIAAAPWVYHVVTSKRTSGISEKSLYFVYGALLCTLTYAAMIVSTPLIVSCLKGLTFNVIVTTYYYMYRKAN